MCIFPLNISKLYVKGGGDIFTESCLILSLITKIDISTRAYSHLLVELLLYETAHNHRTTLDQLLNSSYQF